MVRRSQRTTDAEAQKRDELETRLLATSNSQVNVSFRLGTANRYHSSGISSKTDKHLFATRPIFHKLDETIRGHVACSFLALVLKVELEERIDGPKRTVKGPRHGAWPEILADLDSLTETLIEHGEKRFIIRSAPRPAASLALRAAGVALPPTVRPAGDH